MTAALSRFSHALRVRMFGDEPAQAVLPLVTVLEEEYAALHPGPDEPPADTSYHAEFTPDDIADLPGFACALVDSTRANPLFEIGMLVLKDQGELADLLRHIAAANEARVRQLLARRLTALLGEDIEAAKPFESTLRTIRDHDDGTFDRLLQHERNRVLLEAAFAPFVRTTQDRRLAAIIARIHSARHTALCLSGGGIRSASFAMGVVQGLARRGLLSRFHYLSTVSGGGYTGSWLSAWMARAGAARVHEQLAGARTNKPETEPATLRHIRAFSYFLNPRFGLMSADTWTLIATIARNILLIWLVTLPVLAAALMLPRLFVAGPMTTLRDWNSYGIDPGDLIIFFGVSGTVLAIVAIAFVQRNLYTYSDREDADHSVRPPVTLQQFITWCFAPLMIAMVLLAQAWEMTWSMIRFSPAEARALAVPLSHRAWTDALIALDPQGVNADGAAMLSGIAFWTFVYLAAWLFGTRLRGFRLYSAVLSALCGAVAGAIGGLSSAALFGLTSWKHAPEFYATFAVPLSLTGMLVSMHLVVGLASRRMTDAARESNARFSAWLLIGVVGWMAVVGITLYGPFMLLGATIHLKHLLVTGGVTGVLASGLAASSQASAKPNAETANKSIVSKARDAALALAVPLFAVIVVVLVSMVNGKILRVLCTTKAAWCPTDDSSGRTDLFNGQLSTLAQTDYASPQFVLLALAGLLAVGYILGRLIDTNRFSLHAMYRVRLVRTFLGASRPPGERQPNPFTGFDETDDMPIGDLWPPVRAHGEPAPVEPVHPPLHVVNVTLNTVASTDLATQNRKATSFTMSSLHSGAAGVGYRRTCAVDDSGEKLYGGKDGVSLGTAMAISGAAASPNMGYHSSPTVTFLMTLFNARLGWWLGNPGPAGKKSFNDDEPKLALVPILDEMFGRTTDHSPYVYLSDGGHFENLGLYEMVRRRCRFIVVSDAGCDPKCAFDDLGGAIRKIRIDFGVPIEFESGIPIYSRSAPKSDNARYHAIGRILYSQADGGGTESDGILLYIKPAFYGREPYDVFNYAHSTPDFPHEATGNQFFGESQFESYRALGEFAVDQMCQAEFAVPADSAELIARSTFDAWFRTHLSAPLASDARLEVSDSRAKV
jgi:hypothetical protein